MAKFSRLVGSSCVDYLVACQKEVKTQALLKLEVSFYSALPLHSNFRGLMWELPSVFDLLYSSSHVLLVLCNSICSVFSLVILFLQKFFCFMVTCQTDLHFVQSSSHYLTCQS